MGQTDPYFVSYASSDGDRVDPLLRFLEAQGLSIWKPKSAPVTGNLAAEIGRALQAAPSVLAFLTEASLKSHWFLSEIHAAYIQNKLVVFKLDALPTADIPIDLKKVRLYDLVEKSNRERAAILYKFANPDDIRYQAFPAPVDPAFESFLGNWNATIPKTLAKGNSTEFEITLENDELRYLIESENLEDHPVFGTNKREPTVSVRFISLSGGIELHEISDNTQWVSSFNSQEQTVPPTTWRYQLVANEPGSHKLFFQLNIRGADRSGLKIENKLYERTSSLSVHSTWAQLFRKLGLWTLNSIGAAVVGFYIAELVR